MNRFSAAVGLKRVSFHVEFSAFFNIISYENSLYFSFNTDPTFTARFSAPLGSVLRSLVSLMSESRERMNVQNTALRHLPTIIDPIYKSHSLDVDKLWLDQLFSLFIIHLIFFLSAILSLMFWAISERTSSLARGCHSLVNSLEQNCLL